MSSAHTLPLALDRCLRAGFFNVLDPGSGNTISWSNKGRVVCIIDTAGAESRALPLAEGYAVDTELVVNLRAAVGALTITGAVSSVVLSSAGDVAFFKVAAVSETDKQWVLVNSSSDVAAAGAFGTDNVLLRSDGTGRGVQATGIVVDDSDNITSKLSLLEGTGAASASGLLMGGGTEANPNTTATVSANFFEFWCRNTAASGLNRLAYLQFIHDTDGTSSGECLRARTLVNANIATAHGAHIGLSYEAVAGGSETSGLGVAVRGTVEIPDIASWAPAGTVAAGMFELFSNGVASDPAGLTELSLLRLVNGGNATGAADVDTDAFLLSIQGFATAAGVTNVLSSTSPAEFDLTSAAIGIRVKIGAGTYYIPAIPAADWN